MRQWPDKLFIYEINTWVWLDQLSRRYKKRITLADVPEEALDDLTRPNIDVIWLMGVWKRSEHAQKHALKYKHEYVGALPDINNDDVIGSAYSIADYEVDARIGGRKGLAAFRKRLKKRGLRLLLDYVPNHVALDHPWVHDNPDFMILGKTKDAAERPGDFFTHRTPDGKTMVLAHGRDPYFPGWADIWRCS
jgi:glycosidase